MNPQKILESVEVEAAAWIARLHNTDRTSEDDRSFQRWLSENPMHKAAFEGMTDAWEAAGKLKSDVLSRQRLAPLDGAPGARSQWRGGGWAGAGAIAAAIVCAALGILFFRDDGIATGVGERRDIGLPDGSRLTLNTDTRVKVKYDDRRRMVLLERGEAFFDVAARPNLPFIVKTRDSRITALGTSFSVRSEREKTEVTLLDGKVAVASALLGTVPRTASAPELQIKAGQEVMLSPGQRLTLASKAAPKIDQPIVEKVTAWRRGLIALDRTPLSDAIAEMNRYSAVKLAVDASIGNSIQVSGIFHAGDSQDFAKGLASSHGLKIIESADTLTLAGP